MITQLVRVGGFASGRYTRHAFHQGSHWTLCTRLISDALPESPSQQGTIHNCKRCVQLTDSRLWEGKRTDDPIPVKPLDQKTRDYEAALKQIGELPNSDSVRAIEIARDVLARYTN